MPDSHFSRFEYAGFVSFPVGNITTTTSNLMTVPGGKAFILTAFDAILLSGSGALGAELYIVRSTTTTRIWFSQPAGGTEELLAGLNGFRVLVAGDILQFENLGGVYDVCASGFFVPQAPF